MKRQPAEEHTLLGPSQLLEPYLQRQLVVKERDVPQRHTGPGSVACRGLFLHIIVFPAAAPPYYKAKDYSQEMPHLKN